jgi:dipeptidyl aminopeptidase/acylaminoacyl peptidase
MNQIRSSRLSVATLSLILSACAGQATAPCPEPKVAEATPPKGTVAPPKETPKAEANAKPSGDYKGLGAESVSPEVIAQFAPRALDALLSRRIQRMLDIQPAGAGLLTNKGDRLVFTWRVTGTSQVWRMDGPKQMPIQLTGGEDSTIANEISPDDKFIVVSRDVGGQENPGLYWMNIEGGPLVEIQHKEKVQTYLAFISDDSRFVFYRANDIDPASYAIYRFEKESGKRELIFSEKGHWEVADHRGEELLLDKAVGSDQIEYYTYDMGKKKLTPLFGQGEKVRYSAQFGAKPGTILVQHDKTGDFSRLYEWKDGKETPISPAVSHEVAGFFIDHARTRISYMMNEDGYTKLHVIDAKTYAEQALPKLPDAEHVFAAGASRDGRYLALGASGATLPPTTAFYDWKTKKLVPWRSASTPEIDTTKFTKAKLESYPARDGTKIPVFVWKPEACNNKLCPVVVDFHGGPEGQSQPGFAVSAQMYNDAGFILLRPNVRGSTGYGKKWLDADNGPKRLEIVTDIEDAGKYAKQAFAKDGKTPKVGVTGGSYGGYSTLMAMTYFAGTYDAGVSNVGIANMVTFLANTAPYRRALRVSEYGDPDKDREALVKMSPTTYIDRLKAPLLIIQGVNDPRVPVGEALQMFRALESRNVPAGLILFADEGHGAAKRSNIVLTIGHTIAFFEKHLK